MDTLVLYQELFIIDLTYYGKKSEVLIFPSNTIHEVETLKENKTRITLAFNLYKI